MKATNKTSLQDNGIKNSHKIYQNYTDSDIRWLENIPSSWTEATLSQILRTLESGSRDSYDGEEGVLSIGGEHINFAGKLNLEDPRFISENHYAQMNQGKVKTGDTLLVKDGATIGKTAYIEESFFDSKAAINSHVYILRPRDVYHKKYLYYLLFSKFAQQQIDLLITGSAQAGLSSKFAKFVDVPLPPKKDQKAIVKFLDRETSKIDRLIEKKEELIDLLEEKRKALITKVVTKGYNENVEMKDSGNRWLGEIPENWDKVKLKFVLDNILDGAHETPTYVNEGVPFLKVKDISERGQIDWDNVSHIPEEEHHELIKRCKPEQGDVLLSKNGTVGIPKVVDFDKDFSIFVSLCLLKPGSKLDPRFTEYLFFSKHIEEQIYTSGKENTITNLHLEKIKDFFIAIPPKEEQSKIVNFLDDRTKKLDSLIEKTERGIKKLKEYRTALISDAVTGKIDVRGEVE